MDREWKQLYDAAKSKLNPRQISPLIEAGGVASAVLTDRGSIYTGVCIDTACGLEPERSFIMISLPFAA